VIFIAIGLLGVGVATNIEDQIRQTNQAFARFCLPVKSQEVALSQRQV
jgi:hypothetical protein